MRAVNTFCTAALLLALAMTAIHYAFLHWRSRSIQPATAANDDQPEDVMDPSDYAASVLPDQEKAHGDWIERARKAARDLASTRGEISSDDIWDIAPPPAGVDPRVIGAVFSDKTMWQRLRYDKSTRKINHGRPVSVWTLRAA